MLEPITSRISPQVRQILEGKYRDLIVLFEKIRRDRRHKNVCLESRQYIDQRSFRKWGVMTLVVTAGLEKQALIKMDVKNEKKTTAATSEEQKILQVEYTSRLKNKDDIGEIMAIARIKNQVLGVGGKLSLYLQDSL
uniref:BLUF domain-containing protein n=1 Tax=Lotharella oceanica TaxID=641309 RepID=A0A7S2XHB8_9EUKA|mmetsp:Transcript_6080/g.12173  ORF Transcript_6080/g.12173 Transcript_6080/m.12173 type:complete len:137 (+) Transcript_6080:341-751(+)